MSNPVSVIGLDIGRKRTGVARVNIHAKLPEPIGDIDMDGDIKSQLLVLIDQHAVDSIVAGLPLDMRHRETEQTTWTNAIITQLKSDFPDLKFYAIDEVGTSKLADERSHPGYSRDAVAACILLEDFVKLCERGDLQHVSI